MNSQRTVTRAENFPTSGLMRSDRQPRKSPTAQLVKFLALALAAGVTACDLLNPVACTDELRAGIVVTVLDAATGAPIPGWISVVARDGEFVDSVPHPPAVVDHEVYGPFPVTYERPGTYQVRVVAAGYREWIQEDVRVAEDECHVRTQRIEAKLQK